jgi:hypothetical protein
MARSPATHRAFGAVARWSELDGRGPEPALRVAGGSSAPFRLGVPVRERLLCRVGTRDCFLSSRRTNPTDACVPRDDGVFWALLKGHSPKQLV